MVSVDVSLRSEKRILVHLDYLSLSPPRRSRVEMMLYFPFYTLMNVNIWNFFTYMFELERAFFSEYAERLALLPAK